jgi:DNA-binding beta-propeller fold protein YncE
MDTASRAFPQLRLGCGHSLIYVGSYLPDGKFQSKSTLARWADSNPTIGVAPTARPNDVPASVHLHSREHVVENLAPSTARPKHLKGQSVLATWRDDILTLAYGRERPVLAPHYVTSDSQGRAIISDPVASAIHVLDNNGGFRIPAGKQYRLHSAGAVAVDDHDNIYAADSDTGLIIVFDHYGHFLREIGRFSPNEGMFHDPSGLAIDRANGRLYVSDASRDTVFALALDGTILRRMGGRRHESGIAFQHPESIAVKNDRLIVLDAGGSRIQVFDNDGAILRSFSTGLMAGYVNELGMAVDSDGNIYLSNIDQSQFRVFDPNGREQTEFGARGSRRGEFYNPAAMWIDPQDRMYISDEGNRRVQVFQIRADEEDDTGTGLSTR